LEHGLKISPAVAGATPVEDSYDTEVYDIAARIDRGINPIAVRRI
jgi:hypothetical protein